MRMEEEEIQWMYCWYTAKTTRDLSLKIGVAVANKNYILGVRKLLTF